MTFRRALLFVDDEAEILELLALAFHDFDVATALNANAALELLRARPFDAIVTDVRMPGQSGLSLIDRAVTLRPDLAVIVMTGHHQDADSDTRVARWILKPFSIAGIRAAVQEVLNGRR